MRLSLSILFSLFLTITIIGQNPIDSGFTNKAEAKNIMVNGLKEGSWLEYFSDNYTPLKVADSDGAAYYTLTIYKTGKAEGIVREYFGTGNICSETRYVHGKKNGVKKDFYSSGAIFTTTPYTNDSINGMYKEYYRSGKLKGEVPYVYGKKNGLMKYYYETGNPLLETVYTNGVEYTSKQYDQNGKEIKK